MSDSDDEFNPPPSGPSSRLVGGTEYSWCKAVPTGTGTTVLALLLSAPPEPSVLRSALHTLQNTRPILRSKLRFHADANSFSFVTVPAPYLEVATFDLQSTSQILKSSPESASPNITPFHLLHEYEMNQNSWLDPKLWEDGGVHVFQASQYALSETQWAVVLRLHTGACDRSTAAELLRDLKRLVGGGESGTKEIEREEGLNPTIEELIPKGKADKPFWARGMNMLGYSLNALRMANLRFEEAAPPRVTQMVRLTMNSAETDRLLSECMSRGIKLCGALSAAALMAAHSSKNLPENTWEKYGVVTLVDCRSLLDPPLPIIAPGFYHSAILNSHDICGNETLWELSKRTYTSFSDAKASNKHFSDMSDLNFLMCRAIDSPGLTPSGSLRTAILSVFEDSIVEVSDLQKKIGLEDYLGCASVHGVGPSVALFHTIRDGCLDCLCPYPSPLHSREQMQRLIDEMKRILAEEDH